MKDEFSKMYSQPLNILGYTIAICLFYKSLFPVQVVDVQLVHYDFLQSVAWLQLIALNSVICLNKRAIYSYFKRSGTSNSVAIYNNITVFIVVWYLHVQPSSYTYSPQLVQQGLNLMRLPSRKDTLHYCYKQHSLVTLVTNIQISLHIAS